LGFTVDWIGLGEEVQPEAIHGSVKQTCNQLEETYNSLGISVAVADGGNF
jgi:hypothetical protein